MGGTWQVQEAKNRFSELIETALSEGPQIVTHHGKPVVKIVALTPSESRASFASDGFVPHLLSAPRGEKLRLPKRASRKAALDLDLE